jgi:peptidyl-prolyl cis-trans isomerase B (cyclophilin B)
VRTARLLAAFALAAAATLRADAEGGDLVLEATLEQRTVKVGEDAVLLVTLTNHASAATRVAVPRLARDAISVRVAAANGVAAVVTRLHGTFQLADAKALEFLPSPSPTRKLDPNESVQARIAVPALLGGEMTLTAVLGDGAPTRVEAKPVVVEVQGRGRVGAQVETSKGVFRVDLDPAAAYASAASFWSLAREGFFDGLPFHRVVAGALAQTGDPRGNGTGGPGWFLPGETPVVAATRGDVGLARGVHPDSAGSQWFVVADAKNGLDGGYVRLGAVVDGLDVVDTLCAAELDAKTGRPKTASRVLSVKTLVR